MHSGFRSVAVIGLGYIGLPTAAILASRGVRVTGVDINSRIVDTVNKGDVHIVEPDLREVVRAAVEGGCLTAHAAPQEADAFIIAVPTPTLADRRPDLTYVHAAIRSIAPSLRQGNLIIIESTCPVGTTESVSDALSNLRPDLSFPKRGGPPADIFLAYCPERVLPGKTLTELVANDRSIGGMTRACGDRAAQLYEIFVEGECVPTDARTAELVKLTENAYRDVNIAFANELSLVCEAMSVDVWGLIELANRHPRVNILQPGPGVGGHCIAVDPWFIIQAAPDVTPLMRAARAVNDGKSDWVVERVAASARASPGVGIACLGLAYKADVDDLRESPALRIAVEIAHAFPGRVTVVEPNIEELPSALAGLDVRLASVTEAMQRCEIILALVAHRPFMAVDATRLRGKSVIDAVGLWRG